MGDEWKDKVALIKDGAVRLKEALKDIFQDPDVTKAREGFYLAFSEMLGAIAGTWVRIGLNIGANLAQGIATALENKAPEITLCTVNAALYGTDHVAAFKLLQDIAHILAEAIMSIQMRIRDIMLQRRVVAREVIVSRRRNM